MHTIEIDSEVYECLKSQAEPFVEATPNAVLRRLLLKKNGGLSNTVPVMSSKALPNLSNSLPQALRQILAIVILVRVEEWRRQDATKRIAKFHRVEVPTVQDKYTRQLSLNTSDFDRLLEEDNLDQLESILISHFPRHREAIEDILKRVVEPVIRTKPSRPKVTPPIPAKVPTEGQFYTLDHLASLKQKTLAKNRPKVLLIGDERFDVKTWTELSVTFVEWLINKGQINESHLPVYTYAMKDRYFISASPSHKYPEKDGQWKEAGNYFVDIKFNALNHVRNIETALNQIGLPDPGIKILVKLNPMSPI